MTRPPDPADPSTVLLIDLDGTITDSFAGIANSFRYALDEVGVPYPPDEVIAGIAGPPMIDTLTSLGLDDDAAAAAMAAYRRRYTTTGWVENSVFDGMDALLADLARDGRVMAVATSKNERTARTILEHFALAQHFRVIAGASDDGTRRHKSEVIAHALDALSIQVEALGPAADDPARGVVMIGDREHDVDGAARFGIAAIQVGWGYAVGEEGAAATWRVDTVEHLREVLGV